jgi:hypothetical protein
MSEELLKIHYQDYKNGNDRVIIPTWDIIKGATKFHRLFDYSGCLTKDDFKMAGIMGCKKGLDTFEPGGGSKLTSWLIQLSNQSMIRQLRLIPTQQLSGERFVITIPMSRLDHSEADHLKNSHFIDLLFSKIQSSFEPSFIYQEYCELVISLIRKRLFNYNRRILEFFSFKIEHSEIDGPTCARMLRINQTSYNKYMKIIRETLIEVIRGLDED